MIAADVSFSKILSNLVPRLEGQGEKKNSIFQTYIETKSSPTKSWVLNAACATAHTFGYVHTVNHRNTLALMAILVEDSQTDPVFT